MPARRPCSRAHLPWRNDVRKAVQIAGTRNEREDGNHRGRDDLPDHVLYYLRQPGYSVHHRHGQERRLRGDLPCCGPWLHHHGARRQLADRHGARHGAQCVFRLHGRRRHGFFMAAGVGAVFISGVIFLLLTVTGVRRWLVDGIPHSLRSAIAAGIGMFLALIGLKSAGVVVGNQATLVGMGDLTQSGPLLAIAGFFIIAILDALKVRGAILIGILVITVASIALGISQFGGIFSAPPSLAPTFLQLDIMGALHTGILHVILVFVLVEVFDATGTLIGVAKRGGLIETGKPNNLGRALFADSGAILAGSLIGTSSTTAYVESAAGVQAGGRTGLTALVVGILFLAALFISPLAGSVPAYATAPALVYVACLMMRELTEIEWHEVTEAAPAAL
ncbi:xanthine/uracil/vitamin C permease, partial [Brucella pinnipedialis M163/99/10]